MKKNNWWKWLLLVALLLGSALSLFKFDYLWNFLPTRITGTNLRYGLDISGGCSFTLQADEERLREMILERDKDKSLSDIRKNKPGISDEDAQAELDAEIDRKVQDALRNFDETAGEIIRNRIDPLGIEEPVITRAKNAHRIYVQLTGADPESQEKARKLVGDVAFLEFRLVHPNNSSLERDLFSSGKAPEGYRIVTVGDVDYYEQTEDYAQLSAKPGYATRLAHFELPSETYAFMVERVGAPNSSVQRYRPIFVRRTPEMTGEHLRHSEVGFGEKGYSVLLKFDGQGSRDFFKVTSDYCPYGRKNKNNGNGRQLAIILDGVVYSAPVIQTAIRGNAEITGRFTPEDATYLKNILNAGALPAPMKIISQRSVSPTVGEDALRGAKQAMLWGIGAIVVFMLVYYGVCGVVADIAFLLNIALLALGTIIVSWVFSIFDSEIHAVGSSFSLPVLTLPGIAGLLLTFGMAVDANVLTFERTREEFAAGKTKFSAIMAGYERAFLAIFDSNVTTIITAAILFAFGSGTIRGFAITLTAGIIVSMFTVLFVTKLIFLSTVKENSTGSLKMMQLVPSTLAIDFVGKARAYTVLAVALVIVGFGTGIARGVKNIGRVFAVDFTGGAKITYEVANPETVEGKREDVIAKVRETFVSQGIDDANPQFQQDGDSLLLEVMTVRGDTLQDTYSTTIATALTENVPETVFKWRDVDTVGSQVGGEFRKSAITAVTLALIGMILYITVRFEFGFALGALVALVHDVFVTLGLYLLLGCQISLITVAAILTIVGYSVNDTIVIFDRIREELRNPRSKNLSMRDLCNKCVNTTLSRTVLTSITTAITVIALLCFSTGDIRNFAIIMLIGVVFGTFSTIFIATPVMMLWHKGKRPDLTVKK